MHLYTGGLPRVSVVALYPLSDEEYVALLAADLRDVSALVTRGLRAMTRGFLDGRRCICDARGGNRYRHGERLAFRGLSRHAVHPFRSIKKNCGRV